MTRLIAISLVLYLTGCAVGYEEAYIMDPLLERQSGALSKSAGFVVAVQGDGRYGDKVKAGSAAKTRSSMVEALSKHATRVQPIPGFVSEAQARHDARSRGTEFLIYMQILNWEERVTAWSGKPDRLEVEIRLIDVNRDKMLEAVVVKGNSKFATLGGDHVEDLLAKPFNDYAASLFGIKPAEKT